MRFLLRKNLITTDYFFHFEPRLLLINPAFLLDFIENPRPVVCISPRNQLAISGYYGGDKMSIQCFVNSISLAKMCLRSISIESLLFKHAKVNSWEIQLNSGYCIRFDPEDGAELY